MDYKTKIDAIALILSREYQLIPHYGLHSGTSESAMFLIEYAKYSNDKKYIIASRNLINCTIELLKNTDAFPTFCTGISGVGWFFSYLEKQGIIDDINYDEIDNYLLIELNNQIKLNHYDFLHGALGISFYFIFKANNTKNSKYAQIISELIDWLSESSINESYGEYHITKWMSYDITKQKNIFNISMSHGMSSILVLLTKIINICKSNEKKKVEFLIEGVVNYITTQNIDFNIYGSHFPSYSIESEITIKKSRLAWCYGDLGIACAIWQAGKALNKLEWQNIAKRVLLDAANRTNLDVEFVTDAGLCHGTAGIAHIFNRMYCNIGDSKLKIAHDFWVNETLKMSKFKDGLAGYKAINGNEYINDSSLLEGISGIGLMLLSSISDNVSNWDECLLLN